MDDILTDDELTAWSGLRQNAARRRWLIREGVRFTTRADGFPNVLRGDRTPVQEVRERAPAGPRLDRVVAARAGSRR